MRTFGQRLLIAAALLVWSMACSSEPVRVTTIQLGRGVNADNTAAKHTSVFDPGDTVYVSIATTGVGSAELGVKWTYGGRVMGEPKKQVSFRDDAATEFHLQSAGGFPEGAYKVEVFLNGQSVGTREFTVE